MCRGIRSTTLRNCADKLQGEDRNILKLRPGITGPASLKYRDEEELLASVEDPIRYNDEVICPDKVRLNKYCYNHYSLTCGRACSCSAIGKQACHCSRVLAAFWTDIKMLFATVLAWKMEYAVCGDMI